MLSFREKIMKIWEKGFLKNKILLIQINLSFDFFLNINTNSMAEQVSKFIDLKLRKCGKIIEDESIVKNEFDQIFEIFKFLIAKDVFEAFFTKRLLKRLLFNRMSSMDLEILMINKLKAGKFYYFYPFVNFYFLYSIFLKQN